MLDAGADPRGSPDSGGGERSRGYELRSSAPEQIIPLRSILDAMREGVFAIDREGKHVYSNRSLKMLVGDSVASGGAHPHFVPADQRPELSRRLMTLFSGGKTHPFDLRVVEPSGRRLQCVVTLGAVKDSAANSVLALALLRPPATETEESSRVGELLGNLHGIAKELEVIIGPDCDDETPPDMTMLSSREREVLELILEGRRVPSIARLLTVSPHTVRNHLKSIFKKLGVRSQLELVDRMRP